MILYVKRDIFLGVEGCGDCEVYERGIWGAGGILSLLITLIINDSSAACPGVLPW